MAPDLLARFLQGSTFLLLLLPTGVQCDGSLALQDLLASWREPGRISTPSNGLAIANGSIDVEDRGAFRPSPIVDPKEDIDCEAQECMVDEGDHKARCSDWPERLCRSYEPCEGKTASGKVCLHKSFWPLLAEDAELFISLFLIATAAGATGIGGGGLNVPMLMLWSKFDIKEGVPLSHCAVLGNAFAMLLVNAPQRHPLAERRPLIYYELALLLLPAMLGGSSLGVIVGRIFPPALLIVLSIVLLVLTTAKTLVKARHIAKAARAREDNSSQGPLDIRLLTHADGVGTPALTLPWGVAQLSHNSDGNGGARSNSSGSQMEEHGNTTASTGRLESPTWVRTWSGEIVLVGRKQALLDDLRERAVTRQARERRLRTIPTSAPVQSAPWAVIYLLILCSFGFTIDLVILKGQPYCTVGYWGFLAALYPILVAGVASGIWALRRLDRQGAEMRADGDVAVTAKNMMVYPSITMIIGLVAGLLGLGGGEFTVPLLLELGLHSRVASATSGLLMVFMTLSNIIHYSIAGTLELFLGYASTLACIAFLGGLLGLFIRDRPYVQKHNYLMVYLLAVLLAIAAVLLGARGWSSLREPTAWQFQGFCS